MDLYIALDKNHIRGIFNNENLISKKNNCFIIKYPLKTKGIIGNDEIVYVFFQYIDDDFKNIKIFDQIEDAIEHRDNKFSYGHIIGMKQDQYYESLLNLEYISVKELS